MCVIFFCRHLSKNPKIDVLNYIFRISLSDATDEIKCEVTVEVKYVDAGVEILRLDLINVTPALQNKGMRVSGVVFNGKSLSYSHDNDELKITTIFGKELKRNIKSIRI